MSPRSRRTGQRQPTRRARAALSALSKLVGRAGRRIDDHVLDWIEPEIDDRLARVPTELNEYGYDPFGLDPRAIRRMAPALLALYRYYFRVEVHGIEHVPEGRVLLISNHSGQIPLDGSLIGAAMLLEAEPPRLMRSMVEYWASELPFVSTFFARMGQVIGTPGNFQRLIEREEAILVFPEGTRGINKTFDQRYKLQPFSHGFMRLALANDCPIVPLAVVGCEEMIPALANASPAAKLLGMPALPITPTFPLLGPAGFLPYPVKVHIHVGRPMSFSGDPEDDDSVIGPLVDSVRQTIQTMLYRGLRERKHIFW